MPELPEVETVLRSLTGRLEGQIIIGAEVIHPKVVEPLSPEGFATAVEGTRIHAIRRRGKYLLLDLDDDHFLLIHLRMTGRLALVEPHIARPNHTHVVLHLSSGLELRFVDPRRFGRVTLMTVGELQQVSGFHQLGPEPLGEGFTQDYLATCARRRKVAIKGLLLNQNLIAGLGNIYTDEALHLAGIHPERTASSLTEDELSHLFVAIRHVLQEGIAHRGSSFRDYVDAQGAKGNYQELWRVYGRSGQPCPTCGSLVTKSRVAGRGTHWCPRCQPAPSSASQSDHT